MRPRHQNQVIRPNHGPEALAGPRGWGAALVRSPVQHLAAADGTFGAISRDRFLGFADNGVDDAVRERLLSIHPVVAIDVAQRVGDRRRSPVDQPLSRRCRRLRSRFPGPQIESWKSLVGGPNVPLWDER